MSILYAMPPIGNQGNAQKGPTCWYYAAKMVAQCHAPWPPADQKWVSLIRKISTHLAANGGNLNQMDAQGLTAVHGHFQTSASNKDKLKLNAALSRTGYKALEPAYKWDVLPPSPMGSMAMNPVPTPEFMRPQDLPLPSNLKHSLDQLQDQQFDHLEGVLQTLSRQHDALPLKFYRSQIESCFSPTKKHSVSEVEASLQLFLEWRTQGFHRSFLLERLGFKSLSNLDILRVLGNINEFDALLKQKGPLWCSSLFGIGQPDVSSKQSYSKVNVVAFKCPMVTMLGGTAHAISICGVSVDKNCIYYRDPNLSSQVFFSEFTAFAAGLGSLIKDPNIGLMYYEKNENGGTTCLKLEK